MNPPRAAAPPACRRPRPRRARGRRPPRPARAGRWAGRAGPGRTGRAGAGPGHPGVYSRAQRPKSGTLTRSTPPGRSSRKAWSIAARPTGGGQVLQHVSRGRPRRPTRRQGQGPAQVPHDVGVHAPQAVQTHRSCYPAGRVVGAAAQVEQQRLTGGVQLLQPAGRPAGHQPRAQHLHRGALLGPQDGPRAPSRVPTRPRHGVRPGGEVLAEVLPRDGGHHRHGGGHGGGQGVHRGASAGCSPGARRSGAANLDPAAQCTHRCVTPSGEVSRPARRPRRPACGPGTRPGENLGVRADGGPVVAARVEVAQRGRPGRDLVLPGRRGAPARR